jgi:hypothetical protein
MIGFILSLGICSLAPPECRSYQLPLTHPTMEACEEHARLLVDDRDEGLKEAFEAAGITLVGYTCSANEEEDKDK